MRIVEGLDLPVAGKPEQVISAKPATRFAALIGADYHGLRPALSVDIGQRVRVGDVLFTDRRRPEIRFTSPATGTVREINRGPRRSLASVIVERDGPDSEPAAPLAGGASWETPAEVVGNLCKAGLWTAFRKRPFGGIPDPETRPSAIFVNAIDTDPLALRPQPEIEARAADFVRGLTAIARLTDGELHLCTAPNQPAPGADIPNLRTTWFSGPHPAGLVGTHVHALHPVGPGRTVWHVGWQDVLAIGALIETGQTDVERIVALAGPGVVRPRLVRTTLGADLLDLGAGELADAPVHMLSGPCLRVAKRSARCGSSAAIMTK